MNLEEQRTSCPGFLDEYGIWNNGFECPSIGNQIRVCCGTDSRRYCCTLKPSSRLSTNETVRSFFKKINLAYLTLPIQLSFILLLICLFLLIFFIIFLCYRYHKRKNNTFEQNQQALISNHFPFSPPNHQIFFNEIKDTLTTSTSSSAPVVRLPSDIYSNDWKECFQTTEQPSMNIYPTILSHKHQQQNDIIV